ncbi:MAG: hypothetical protein AB8F78_03375 [Saprospiraceae bacterium]
MQTRIIYRIASLVFGALIILTGSLSCQEELPTPGLPETAREWVEASARHHDPEGRWQAFEANFEVETIAPAGWSYTNNLHLNRALDTFSRTIQSGGYPLVQVVGPSGCSATWPNPDATEAQLRRNGLLEDPCDYILYRRDFYEFLVGIPMIALEGETSFRQNPDLVNAFGTECIEIELTFAAGGLTWFLYINPSTYRLQAAKFFGRNGGGEWLSYEDYISFDGFILKQSQRWYNIDGVTEINRDEIRWE